MTLNDLEQVRTTTSRTHRAVAPNVPGFNSIIGLQQIFVGINMSEAFRNRNIVSRTYLHRVCLLLNGKWESVMLVLGLGP